MDIQMDFIPWLLWIEQSQTWTSKCLCDVSLVFFQVFAQEIWLHDTEDLLLVFGGTAMLLSAGAKLTS